MWEGRKKFQAAEPTREQRCRKGLGTWGAKEKTSLCRRMGNIEGHLHNLLGDPLEFKVKVNIMEGRCPQ